MRWLALPAAVALVVAACGGSPAPTLTQPPDSTAIVAQGTAFTTTHVAAPASAPFTLWFNNMDNELHNVHIWKSDGASVWIGEVFTGPEARTFTVPALAPGTYQFKCDIHPQMTGALVAG